MNNINIKMNTKEFQASKTIFNKINNLQNIRHKANGLLMRIPNFQCFKIKSHHILKKQILIWSLNKNNKLSNKKENIFRFASPKI